MCMYIYVYICVCIYMCVRVYIYCIHTQTQTQTQTQTHIFINIYICIYIYIDTYKYIHIATHTHIRGGTPVERCVYAVLNALALLLPLLHEALVLHVRLLHRHPRLPPQPHCHARQCGRVWCQQGICSAFGSDCCRCDCGASSRGPQSFSSSTRQAALSVACCSRPLRQQR